MIYVFSYLARLLLAGVLLIAGTSKLSSGRSSSRKTLAEFGVPRLLLAPLSFALPIVELVIGCLLLPGASAWFGAIGAATLLLTFNAAIGANLAIGKHPNCNCFGQLHSKPIGWGTFARNIAMAAVACLLVWQGKVQPGLSPSQIYRRFNSEELGLITLTIAVCVGFAFVGFLALHLFRQNGRLLLRIESLEAIRTLAPQPVAARPSGLPLGTLAPAFELPGVHGARSTLANFVSQGKPLLLVFTDPNCGPCNALMPDIAGWQKTLVDEVNIVLVSHGRHTDNRKKSVEYGLMNLLVETSKRKVANTYSALGTPTAVTIRHDGTIGSHPIGGADGIRSLVANKGWTEAGFASFLKVVSQQKPPATKSSLPIGSEAPAFALPDLAGNTVDSVNFNGNGTALLFWNPACGFCQQMLPELKEWEKVRPTSAPRLVLVSNGSRDANYAMGLEAAVLIDDKFAVGQLYGANGTPSGLLISPNGKVASELAVGAPAVMQILADTAKIAIARAWRNGGDDQWNDSLTTFRSG